MIKSVLFIDLMVYKKLVYWKSNFLHVHKFVHCV